VRDADIFFTVQYSKQFFLLTQSQSYDIIYTYQRGTRKKGGNNNDYERTRPCQRKENRGRRK